MIRCFSSPRHWLAVAALWLVFAPVLENGLFTTLSAQSIRISDVQPPSSTNFTVRAKLLITDSADQQMRLDSNAIVITEQGQPRRLLRLACEQSTSQTIAGISAVLTIDVSGSMALMLPHTTTTRLAAAQEAARQFVSLLPRGSDAAITSFDHAGYVNQPFTTDTAQIQRSIASLQPMGGTNYVAGLIDERGGLSLLSAYATSKRRVLIFLTDGDGMEPSADSVIQRALRANVTIHCIAFALRPTSRFLERVAQGTGGLYFEQITSAAALQGAYNDILRVSRRQYQSCEVEWETGCSSVPMASATIAVPALATLATVMYPALVPGWSLSQQEVNFQNVQQNRPFWYTITLQNTGSFDLYWRDEVRVPQTPFFIERTTPNPTPTGGQSAVTIRFDGGVAGQEYAGQVNLFDPCGVLSALRLKASVAQGIAAGSLLAPSSLNVFPPLVCETRRKVTMNLLNPGTTAVTLKSITSTSADITVLTKLPQQLGILTQTPIDFQFAPAATGATAATLRLLWNDGKQDYETVVAVQGRRETAGLTMSQTNIAFGTVPLDAVASTTLTLTNTGSQPLQLPIAPLTISPQFALESIVPNPVPPAQQATLTVRFIGGAPNMNNANYTATYRLSDVCTNTATLTMSAAVQSGMTSVSDGVYAAGTQGTYAAGMYAIGMPPTLTIESLSPNPAATQMELRMVAARQARISVEAVNMAGMVLSILFDGTLAAGAHTLPLSVAGIAQGAYWLRVRCAGGGEGVWVSPLRVTR
jgi:Mg-chelatase subunit ChlD